MTDPRGEAMPAAPRQRLVAALVVALALVSGLVLGVALDRGVLLGGRRPFGGPPGFGMRGGPHRPPEMRQRFATDLGLSAAQMTQIDSIMSRQMAKRRALADTMDEQMHRLMDSTRAAVDRVLDPEQRQKLAVIRAHRDSARGPNREHRFGPGRPPPPGDGPP